MYPYDCPVSSMVMSCGEDIGFGRLPQRDADSSTRSDWVGGRGGDGRHGWRLDTGDACDGIPELEVLLAGLSALADGRVVVVAGDVWLVVLSVAVRAAHPAEAGAAPKQI